MTGEPLTDADLDNFAKRWRSKDGGDDVRRLIGALRADRGELAKVQKLVQVAHAERERGWNDGYEAARRGDELAAARAEIERLTAERDAATVSAAAPVFDAHRAHAEIEALRARIGELDAALALQTEHATLDRRARFYAEEDQDRAEARLAAVIALCDRIDSIEWLSHDGYVLVADVRAAAAGTEPQAER